MTEPRHNAQSLRIEKQRLIEILDFSLSLCAMVTGGSEIVYANQTMIDWLGDESSVLCERAGRLTAKDAEAAQQLRNWIAATVSAGGDSARFLTIERDDNPPVILRAHEFNGAPEGDGSQPLALISVHDALASRSLGELSRLFELTTAERALVEHILSGASMADAETALGITANTARTHMKSIYRKTGARSQADLVRLLKDAASITAPGREARARDGAADGEWAQGSEARDCREPGASRSAQPPQRAQRFC